MNFTRIRKRKLSNFLLQPLLQTKIGIYSIVLSFVFATIIGYICYQNLASLFDFILDLTDARQEVADVLANTMTTMQAWIYLSLFGYVLATMIISILYTHKLVGPTVAFLRHLDAIKRGDYEHRTTLRKNDAFSEVADKLNEVSEHFAKKE